MIVNFFSFWFNLPFILIGAVPVLSTITITPDQINRIRFYLIYFNLRSIVFLLFGN